MDLEERYNRTSKELEKILTKGLTGNIINIINEFDWCVNYHNISHDNLPAVYINEFRQNLSTFAASLNWALSSLGRYISLSDYGEEIPAENNDFNKNINHKRALAPYKDMYSYTSTGIKYVFPYFKTSAFSLNNSYGGTEQNGSSILGQTLTDISRHTHEGLGKLFNDIQSLTEALGSELMPLRDKGIFIERPQFFQYDTSAETVDVSFTLYNTITEDAWKRNYNFIKMFIFKNSPYKLSAFKYKTPVLYELTIPGVKYYPICYVSSFSANNLGTTRIIDKTTVPEAWAITITFTSLLNRSGNLIQAATNTEDVISVSITRDN